MSLRFRVDDNCTAEERAQAISVLKSYSLPNYKVIFCSITRKRCKHQSQDCAKCSVPGDSNG